MATTTAMYLYWAKSYRPSITTLRCIGQYRRSSECSPKNVIVRFVHVLVIGQEVKIIEKELEPIKHKCLGIVASNHHRRLERVAGISLDEMLCNSLGIPFLGAFGLLCITCGGCSYYVVMHHGTGGGKKRGSKTNNTASLAEIIPGADLYMEGHTHAYDSFIDEMTYIDRKRRIVSTFNAQFVVTGHYLNYDKSYAADMKLKPYPQGSAMVELSAAGVGRFNLKRMTVDLLN